MDDTAVVSRSALVALEGWRGTVHAVLPSSVYAAAADGSMLVVHPRHHGHTPTSLLVDDLRPLTWGLAVGAPVAGRLGRICLGHHVLDARHCPVWAAPAPTPPATPPPAGPLRAFLGWAHGDAVERLGPPCARLRAALTDGSTAPASVSEISRAVRGLVGVGPGLTPSGDDAPVGVLTVLYRAAPAPVAAPLLASLRAALPPLLHRTTPISAHYLRLALAGHSGEHLTTLVDGLGGGGEADPDHLAPVLAHGATSGADTLVGVALGLSVLATRTPASQLKDVA